MKSVHLQEELVEQKESKDNYHEPTKFKNDVLVQNCFEDLQKYIELESKQQDISLWVSKILFCNGAYDEAIRSLNKI